MFSLQGKEASKPAGNCFQLLMVLFTEEYLPTSILCFPLLIIRLWSSLLRKHGFRSLSPLASKPVPRCMSWKRCKFGLSIFAVPKFPNPTHLYYLQIQPLSFAPDLKRLPDLHCMGPNTPLHTQISVSLAPYKLNVSYFYFPFWVHALLQSNHWHVSATHVAIFRGVKTRIKINLQCVGITSHLKNNYFF